MHIGVGLYSIMYLYCLRVSAPFTTLILHTYDVTALWR
jgi:hypothetical protein